MQTANTGVRIDTQHDADKWEMAILATCFSNIYQVPCIGVMNILPSLALVCYCAVDVTTIVVRGRLLLHSVTVHRGELQCTLLMSSRARGAVNPQLLGLGGLAPQIACTAAHSKPMICTGRWHVLKNRLSSMNAIHVLTRH